MSSSNEKREKRRFAIAMVALSRPSLPSALQLQKALEEFPEASGFKDFKEDDAIITFRDAEGLGAVSLISAPIPWQHLEGPCATSWQWPEAAQMLRDHTNHLIVVRDDTEPIAARLKLTSIIAALCSFPECIGIYWGEGGMVHSPKGFVTQSRLMSRQSLPLTLWIDFRGNRNPDGTATLFTQGLTSFGLMEIEVLNSTTAGSVLLDQAFNIAHYLLDRGSVLKDGDTIGLSAEEKIKVRLQPSMWNPNEQVYQISI